MPRPLNLEDRIAKLRQFYRHEKRVPSYSEMMDLFGYHSKNAVYGLIRRLQEYGYVTRSGGKIGFTSKLIGSIRLLGAVQAGFPSPAEEELVDVLSLDEFLVQKPEATFMLTVTGDSMIDAGIHPGDIVLVEKGGTIRKGDIVVAQVDGEWTIKYFGKDKQGAYLDPANSAYKRIRPKESLTIGGKVKASVRKYAS
ncbi:MAG: transcriptional repressor LexA [Verrucomicrobia bacterium]|nr:transcriptional repressor LexA [Verrucomicrobiota bacterium]